MPDPTVLEVYRREVTPELYTEIRELYKVHSIAEDARDLPGLISTLTPDCVYELVQTGHRWEGHEGAARRASARRRTSRQRTPPNGSARRRPASGSSGR